MEDAYFFSNDTKPKVIQHEHLAVGWKENVPKYLSLWNWTTGGDTSTASLKFKFTETYRIFHVKMYVQFTMKNIRKEFWFSYTSLQSTTISAKK
jgi:hypothetical protein